MRAIERDSTRLGLALDHDDAVDAALRKRVRSREAGGSGADDQDIRFLHQTAAPWKSFGASDWTAAVQPNPWQRPIMARVRRFNPPSVPGAIGASSAVRISVSVTHSQ